MASHAVTPASAKRRGTNIRLPTARMGNQTPKSEMLDALELLQYAWRFRNSRFVLVLEPGRALESVMTDLRVLQRAHIAVLIVCREKSFSRLAVQAHAERGFPFSPIAWESNTPSVSELEHLFSDYKVPVAVLPEERSLLSLLQTATFFSKLLAAQKIFFLGSADHLQLDSRVISHATTAEIAEALAMGRTVNLAPEVLDHALQISASPDTEYVILSASEGSLFNEVFTHRGSGTLISNSHPDSIRRATLADVYDILLLMKPSISDGSVLPSREEDIAKDIANYFVYSVNNAVIASAKLNDYGKAAELAKLCTLPRYRGRGRARKLARELIAAATKNGKEYVFGLSTNAEMWAFFESLGFSPIAREDLPEQWKSGYDFSRPSRAFALMLPKSEAST